MFERKFVEFLEEQKRQAGRRRLEMLNRDLSGTKRMLEVLWPALQSFDGVVLEHEIISITGVRVFIDAYFQPVRFALESDGFVSHAEQITRDRFSFERMKIRTIAKYGFTYVPFSRDELDKKPELCLQSFHELLGRFGTSDRGAIQTLPVYEREVLRLGLCLNRLFSVSEVIGCLQLGYVAVRKVLQSLIAKELIQAVGGGSQRFHQFRLTERGRSYLLGLRFG